MLVPKTYQYYPTIPLSDLSDLYSVGANKFGTKNICIISHLPKILRIGVNLPITNKYVLFVEGTDRVDSVLWSVKLYNKGALLDNPAALREFNKGTNEFLLFIDSVFYSGAGQLLFDRMNITCEVKKGANKTTLEVEHSLVQMLNAIDLMKAYTFPGLNHPFGNLYISNPGTTNYLLNCLNDYVTEESLTWNRSPILPNPAERDNLLSTIISIVYHNILNAFSTESTFARNPDEFYMDLDEFDNKNINAHLNAIPEPAYDGSFRNGICRLPLYALNDVVSDFTRVPDFTNISSTNPLYVILSGIGISNAVSYEGVSDFEDRVPEFMLPTIKAAKQRLYGDKIKLIELYNLTAFPKSSIKLAAILVKFIFECSKKNQCKECFKKQAAWPTLGFQQIYDHPDFLKNILQHYFSGPSSEIKGFSGYAKSTFKLTGSPHVDFILHNPPRIVTAYFAKKVVKKTSVGLRCFFERIDSQAIRVGDDERPLPAQPDFDSILGRQLYLVVETLNCRDKELVCGIRSSDLSGNANNLNLVIGPNSWNPVDSSPVFETHSDISVFVGRHAALNNIAGNREEYINVHDRHQESKYNVDHLDKAIIKLNLRPDNQADFDAWAARLNTVVANPEITVELRANSGTYYGNDPVLSDDQGEFLNANDKFDDSALFRVVNRIAYEIFHRENQYSFLEINAAVRKRILRIDNDGAENRLVYFYHDRHDNDHMVCEARQFQIREKGPRVDPPNVPAVGARGALIAATAANPNPISMLLFRNAREDIDALTLTLHDNGTFVAGNGGNRWYPNTGNIAFMINADLLAEPGMGPQNFRAINYLNNPTLAGYRFRITFCFQDTRRRFSNPNIFAGIIGVLAQVNLTPNPDPNPHNIDFNSIEIISEGLSYQDGSCYPSTDHRNGERSMSVI